jgi:hypothetical protein
MTQEIITYCILMLTFVLAGIKIVRSFNNPLEKCQACTGREQGCKLQKLKKEIGK